MLEAKSAASDTGDRIIICDFNLMNSSSPESVKREVNPSLAPSLNSVQTGSDPTRLTGKYSYICNKNATRAGVEEAEFFPGLAAWLGTTRACCG